MLHNLRRGDRAVVYLPLFRVTNELRADCACVVAPSVRVWLRRVCVCGCAECACVVAPSVRVWLVLNHWR